MESTKPQSPENIPADLQVKIDKLLNGFRQKIADAKLNLTPLDDGSGYCGTYHSYHINYKNNGKVFYTSLIDADNRTISQLKSYLILNDEEAKFVQNALNKMLEGEYNLFHRTRADGLIGLDDKKLSFVIRRTLKEKENEFPDKFSFSKNPSSPDYICLIENKLPNVDNEGAGIILHVRLRPKDQIEKLKKEYIAEPVRFYLPIGTKDLQQAGIIKERIIKIFKGYGIAEHHIKNVGLDNTDKIIPEELIDLDKIVLSERNLRNGEKRYRAVFTANTPHEKFPAIHLSFGNATHGQAEKMIQYLRQELIPSYLKSGEREHQSLTLKSIRQNLKEKFPDILEKETHRLPQRFDKRNICVDDSGRIKTIASLSTPAIVYKEQFCRISIVPAKENEDTAVIKNSINVQFNTADVALLQSRTNALQSLSKVVLEEYFKEHPNTEIITEDRNIRKHGKVSTAKAFRYKKPDETAPEGKIFIGTLIDEHLKPAYEQFNRYIYWQTEIKQEEDGSYKISAQIKRNDNAENFPEAHNILGRTWEFRAQDEEAATAFAHKLEENILRKEHLFSRERPVEQFGIESMKVVARESLREAIEQSPHIEDLQMRLTQSLKSVRGRK